MKINFDDNSYIEVTANDLNIFITIAATNADNPLEKIINTAALTKEQFNEIINKFK
jgi:hypothetical protein